MHNPTAAPRIPASARGVSTQRSGPNDSRSPAVARKTPPARPTSSPITSALASRASSPWSASLIASTSVSSATAQAPSQLLELGSEGRGRIGEGGLEDEGRIGWRLRLGLRDPEAHRLGGIGPDLLDEG